MFPHNNEGRDQLLSTYDTETFQEIVNNGCQSGVCSEHILYADTISFFDKYEGEILALNHERYGVDELNKAADDLLNLSIYNPPNSMTLNRYSQS